MTAIGWYGPLIDLSMAASHLDDFVQLLVFVRSSRQIQRCNASKGGTLLKTNIEVGDDTRSYFSVSLWKKDMGNAVVAGDIILLQNAKIIKFRNIMEATTVQISGLVILVHSRELTSSTGIDELVAQCQFRETTREKLRRVIRWVQHTESTFQHVQNIKLQPIKNWKEQEGKNPCNCLSISEVSCITTSCNATFLGRITEICLPSTREPDEVVDYKSINKRLFMLTDNKFVEDLICTGCKLCSFSLDSRCLFEQDKASFYCQKSSKYIHDVCQIYRPFLLYVCDEAGQIPLLVKNKAAEILFGNISAENVYRCYQEEQKVQFHDESSTGRMKTNFHLIWSILVKALLQPGENSPFRFEIAVDMEKGLENGRFEVLSVLMPCYTT